jgi:hypothetical protein
MDNLVKALERIGRVIARSGQSRYAVAGLGWPRSRRNR